MKKTKNFVSSMQTAVWQMKDMVYRDTKKMKGPAYFRHITKKGRTLGLSRKNFPKK